MARVGAYRDIATKSRPALRTQPRVVTRVGGSGELVQKGILISHTPNIEGNN